MSEISGTEIYIHIPFCKAKCAYCDFNSFVPDNGALIFSYIAALTKEIKFAGDQYGKAKISTVYIGGGTPSMLDGKRIEQIVNALCKSFDMSGLKEFTIECNPESVTEEKLALYRALGIDRISLGVQSLDERNLRSIGRLHDAKGAISAIETARKYFDNASADVIVGLPYDSPENVREELSILAPLVEHMSVYQLTLSENVPLFKRVQEGRVLLSDDDEVADIVEVVCDELASQGLLRYEVSNFARKGRESLHNLGYWTDAEYLGFGAGAHSYIKTTDGETPLAKAIRFASPRDINAYIGGVNCVGAYWDIPRVEMQTLDDKDRLSEHIMLGLRTSKGVREELIRDRLPESLKRFFKFENGYASLTREGMEVMNSILMYLI